ncbi:MAG: pseudouridine synthase, partial [Alphaproteobacteria bacterium]
MTEVPAPREYHLQVDSATGTAVDHLAAASGLSRQRIKQAMQKGAVWLQQGKHTRRLRRATRTLQPGDGLHMYYDARILTMQAPAARLLHDAGVYSVWIKPAGMYSQGSKWGDHCAIDRWVARQLVPERPAFIVHRLDRAASGLILIAHQKRSAAALAALFESRRIDKRYRVIVHGNFPDSPRPLAFDTPLDGKPASSHVTRLAYAADRDRSLLEVRINTGRKHQ